MTQRFTIAEVVDTEDLGFFEKGKGIELCREERTKLNSDISVNPSGGPKSKGHQSVPDWTSSRSL